MEIVSGHAPRAPDEVVIDRASQRKGHFTLGETVHVLSQVGSREYTLVRCRDLRRRRQRRRRPGRWRSRRETAAKVLGTPGRYDAIQVVAAARRVAEHGRRRTSAPRCTTRSTEAITGAAATDETRKAAGAVVAVHQHVPDDVRDRRARRRFVRDLQHVLDHRCAAHQGDRVVAGDRGQAQAGDALGDDRSVVHRCVRIGDRCGCRYRNGAGPAPRAGGVRPRAAVGGHRRRARARS